MCIYLVTKYPFKFINMLLKKEKIVFCIKGVRPGILKPEITLKAPEEL